MLWLRIISISSLSLFFSLFFSLSLFMLHYIMIIRFLQNNILLSIYMGIYLTIFANCSTLCLNRWVMTVWLLLEIVSIVYYIVYELLHFLHVLLAGWSELSCRTHQLLIIYPSQTNTILPLSIQPLKYLMMTILLSPQLLLQPNFNQPLL